jgi:hypothetical protein
VQALFALVVSSGIHQPLRERRGGQWRLGCETARQSRPSAELRDAVWKESRDRASRHCESSVSVLQGGSGRKGGSAAPRAMLNNRGFAA